MIAHLWKYVGMGREGRVQLHFYQWEKIAFVWILTIYKGGNSGFPKVT